MFLDKIEAFTSTDEDAAFPGNRVVAAEPSRWKRIEKTNINSVNALKTLLPNEKIKSHFVTRSFLRERELDFRVLMALACNS